MTKPTLDDLLAGSSPWVRPTDGPLLSEVHEIVAEARASAANIRKPKRRTMFWLVPAIGAGALALTGGALATNSALFPDLPISIHYTTDTGKPVSCTAKIAGGSMFVANSNEVVKYFRSRDLSGIGQQIYDHALVLAGEGVATPENTPESDSWVPAKGQGADEKFAFNMSLVDYLVINTEIDLQLSSDGGWLTSDCTGQLH